MARILGTTFFYGSMIEYKKKKKIVSQPSMIAMLVNSGSMSLKKSTRGRRPMNGNASLWNYLVRRRQTKSKLAKQVLKYIDC